MEMPAEIVQLLTEEAVIGHFATSIHDQPHVTPVWLDYDGASGHILINVESVTVKLKQVRKNPRIAISFVSPKDNSHWVSLKGQVVQIEDLDGDASHLQAQASKYLGRPKRNPGHRFLLWIKLSALSWWGGEELE